MSIILEFEISEMSPSIKEVEGYLGCEKVIIQNVKKQLNKGCSDECILKYLHRLSEYYRAKIEEAQNSGDCTNFRYVEDFVNTLIKMPSWKTWIQAQVLGV